MAVTNTQALRPIPVVVTVPISSGDAVTVASLIKTDLEAAIGVDPGLSGVIGFKISKTLSDGTSRGELQWGRLGTSTPARTAAGEDWDEPVSDPHGVFVRSVGAAIANVVIVVYVDRI